MSTTSIGINLWVWTAPINNASLKLLNKVAEMGFNTVEIPLESLDAIDAKKTAAKLKETGLKATVCGAFGPDRDLTSDDAAYRVNGLKYIQSALDFCAAIEATTFVGPMYSAVGKRRHVSPAQKKKEWNLAVDGLEKAGKYAAAIGVDLAVEPLNRFETDLVNTCAQALKMVKDIGLKNVGVHLDTFHMNIEEKCVYDAIKLAGKKLFHFHACENDRGAPGSGLVNWADTAKALKEIGYDRAIVIESFTPKCVSIAAAAAIWRTFASSQDALAKDGLKFLRKTLDK
jgi:D-psicose/D-tagatose/L-ribulose 3-epimerase